MSHLKKFREKNKHPATLEPPCGRLEHTCKATGLQRDLRLLASWKRKFVEKVVGWRCNQNRCSGSKSAKFEVCVHLATASTVCRHMGHLLVVWKLPILHLHTGHGENGAVGRATLGGSSFIQLACAEYAGKPAEDGEFHRAVLHRSRDPVAHFGTNFAGLQVQLSRHSHGREIHSGKHLVVVVVTCLFLIATK